MKIHRTDKTRFKAGKVIITDTNIIARTRNWSAEQALKNLFNIELPKVQRFNESLKKASDETTVVPRVGHFDSSVYLIDIKKNDVTQNTYGVSFPIEPVDKEKTVQGLGEAIAKALDKIG